MKLNLVQDELHQITLQDGSDKISSGVSRVILDITYPIQKRIELRDDTEVKAKDFVNPLVNSLLVLSAKNLDQKVIIPAIYELTYNIHYPLLNNISGIVGDNMLYGRNMLDLIGDSEWLFIAGNYYQVDKKVSTQDALFLKKQLKDYDTTGEIVFREKVYLPLLAKYRLSILEKFKLLTKVSSDLNKLRKLTEATFVIFGIIEYFTVK